MTSDDLPSHNCKNSDCKKQACFFLPDCPVEKLTVVIFLTLNNINLNGKKTPTPQDIDK